VHLTRERIRSLSAITSKGGAFLCHNTVEHDADGEHVYSRREQYCAGALAYALNTGDAMSDTVVQIRLAHKPGNYEKIRAMRGTVYVSLKDWLARGSF